MTDSTFSLIFYIILLLAIVAFTAFASLAFYRIFKLVKEIHKTTVILNSSVLTVITTILAITNMISPGKKTADFFSKFIKK